jgi:SAM-dependent methyltransferase
MSADPMNWLLENEKYFSVELNGYRKPPIGPYLTTLPLVDRDGKILDLGMGNAMLLKFLSKFSDHKLIPYGVEIKLKPLEQAIQEILPQYSVNFLLGDVNEYDFREGPFDIIITNPFYAHPNLRAFTENCFEHLSSDGRIIYRIHDDVLEHFGIKSLSELRDFDGFNMKTSVGQGLVYGIIDKSS